MIRLTMVCGALLLVNCRAPAEASPPLPKVQPVPDLPTADPNTVFELADRKLVVTKADAETIRDLLVARIESQQLEFKDQLLAATRGVGVEVTPEQVRIGTWYVRPSDDTLQAMIRLGIGAAPAYGAQIERSADGWSVGEVEFMRIHPRR